MVFQLEVNISKLKRESDMAQENVKRDRSNVDSLEKLLADTRKDMAQQQLCIDDLKSQIQKYKDKLSEAHEKL